MKQTAIALLLATNAVFAQSRSDVHSGSRFDRTGHLVAYAYADGTEDKYVYDADWRLIRFTDRTGRTTTFVYKNNALITIAADGSRSVSGER